MWSALKNLEHPGARNQTKEQRVQAQISRKTFEPQRHHLSPGSACKKRVSSRYPGTGSSIFLVLFFLTGNAGGSAICLHRSFLPEDAIVTNLVTCHCRDHLVGAPTSMVRTPAVVSQRMRSSTPSFHSLRNSKSRSSKSLLLRIGCHVWIRLRHLQPQHQVYLVLHDSGPQLNMLTASRPQVPWPRII